MQKKYTIHNKNHYYLFYKTHAQHMTTGRSDLFSFLLVPDFGTPSDMNLIFSAVSQPMFTKVYECISYITNEIVRIQYSFNVRLKTIK